MGERICRVLTPADIPAMEDILLDSGGRFVPDRIAHFLNSAGNLMFGAFENDRLVGLLYGYTLCRMDDRAPQFFAYSLDVHTAFRGREIGSELFLYVTEYCRQKGYGEVFVPTEKDNIPACRIYEKAGGRSETGNDIIYVIGFED